MLTDAFGAALDRRALEHPDKIFCKFSLTGEKLSYGELHRRVSACADELVRAGVKAGTRVAICLPTSPAFLVHFLAVIRTGGLVVPIDASLHQDTTTVQFGLLDPQLIVSPPGEKVTCGHDTLEPGVSWLFRSTTRLEPEFEEGRLGIFTSGSTGRPKCVVMSQTNLLAGVEFVRKAHGITASDTAICCMPLSHINGIVTTVLTPLITGGTVVFLQGTFTTSIFIELLRDCRATWFSAAPFHYRMLLYPREIPSGLEACRFGRSASAPLDSEVQHRFEKRYGIPIIETMGLTECSGQVFSNPMATKERKVGSVGRPVGNEAQIVDGSGRVLPDGEAGEIRVRGPNVMLGYLDAPEETAKVLQGGWLYTGDLGYRDSDGFFHINGRKKLIAIFGGVNVSLVAVEEAAFKVSFVKDAAAVARIDVAFGEIIDLYYTGGGLDIAGECEAIRRQLAPVLPSHLAVRRVTWLPDLPRSRSGKLLRYLLTADELPQASD